MSARKLKLARSALEQVRIQAFIQARASIRVPFWRRVLAWFGLTRFEDDYVGPRVAFLLVHGRIATKKSSHDLVRSGLLSSSSLPLSSPSSALSPPPALSQLHPPSKSFTSPPSSSSSLRAEGASGS